MTYAELEAAIWQNMPPGFGSVARHEAIQLVDAILDAADQYALHVSGPNVAELQKSRRIELHRDGSLGRRP